MSIQLPKYIGWPGIPERPGDVPFDNGIEDTPDRIMTDMEKIVLKTMPIAYITPCVPSTGAGLEIYHLDPGAGWDEYKKYLANLEIIPYGSFQGLKVLYQDLSPIGETYSNEFSQSSILGALSEGVSSTIQEMQFVTNKNLKQMVEAGKKSENSWVAGASGLTDDFIKDDGGASKGLQKMGVGQTASNQIVNAVVSGEKIGFPLMWKGSSYSAQYDLSIRLFCPSSKNGTLYNKLIVGPMAALLALALPRTTAAKDLTYNLTYKSPFVIKLKIPGILDLQAGYVSNISVLKGGDVNDRAWNQDINGIMTSRVNIVDVKLTVNPLYNVAPMHLKIPQQTEQPSLTNEVNVMKSEETTINPNPKAPGPLITNPDTVTSRNSVPESTKNQANVLSTTNTK